METAEKLSFLSTAAHFDAVDPASAAESGSQGRPSIACSGTLLKVLFSNVCRFDCAYCVNRVSADARRASFTVDELVRLTATLAREGRIRGLFLSSGIFADPDIVMDTLTTVARRLRTEEGFAGYIHLKIIPGAGRDRIAAAGRWADRLSVNIELPTEAGLRRLAPQKSGSVIFGAMADMAELTQETRADAGRIRGVPDFAPAGRTTQLIVGADGEDDRRILTLSTALYRRYALSRIYYSAFVHPASLPGSLAPPDHRLGAVHEPPLRRRHRLYQADWLLRFYRFRPEELLETPAGYLDLGLDPKSAWALRHLDHFPVDVNRADYEQLLRIPGLGVQSARRILEQRRRQSLDLDGLRRLGVGLKRARYFIAPGTALPGHTEDPVRLRRLLTDPDGAGLQLPLFEF